MSTKQDKQYLQPVPAADKETARTALRAIEEALIRLSGAVEEMGKAVEREDIGTPGMFSILRDSGQDAYGVGADAIEILERILGVNTTMASKETGNPFGDAFRALKRQRQLVERGLHDYSREECSDNLQGPA